MDGILAEAQMSVATVEPIGTVNSAIVEVVETAMHRIVQMLDRKRVEFRKWDLAIRSVLRVFAHLPCAVGMFSNWMKCVVLLMT